MTALYSKLIFLAVCRNKYSPERLKGKGRSRQRLATSEVDGKRQDNAVIIPEGEFGEKLSYSTLGHPSTMFLPTFRVSQQRSQWPHFDLCRRNRSASLDVGPKGQIHSFPFQHGVL